MNEYFENTYGLWECDTAIDCEGMCLAAVEMTRDIVSATNNYDILSATR